MAGIHNVGAVTYNVTNAVIALMWAAGIGYSAYYVGPPVLDAVGDLGTATGVALAVVVVLGLAGEILRRRRRSRLAADASPD
jgi:membrane protein DedA with SNARE-associated domain